MDDSVQFSKSGLPILTQFSEEGFVDCIFAITDFIHSPGTIRFRALASHEDSVVGFGVEMVDEIHGFFDDEMNGIPDRVRRSGVIFHRTGPESDLLLQTLSALYGIEIPKHMRSSESFTAIALQQGELDLFSEAVKIKLFGRDGEPFVEDDYYESFFNIDLPNELVSWNEKDPDYRTSLIKGLSWPTA